MRFFITIFLFFGFSSTQLFAFVPPASFYIKKIAENKKKINTVYLENRIQAFLGDDPEDLRQITEKIHISSDGEARGVYTLDKTRLHYLRTQEKILLVLNGNIIMNKKLDSKNESLLAILLHSNNFLRLSEYFRIQGILSPEEYKDIIMQMDTVKPLGDAEKPGSSVRDRISFRRSEKNRIALVMTGPAADDQVPPQIWIDKTNFTPLKIIRKYFLKGRVISEETSFLNPKRIYHTMRYPERIEIFLDEKLSLLIKNRKARHLRKFDTSFFSKKKFLKKYKKRSASSGIDTTDRKKLNVIVNFIKLYR